MVTKPCRRCRNGANMLRPYESPEFRKQLHLRPITVCVLREAQLYTAGERETSFVLGPSESPGNRSEPDLKITQWEQPGHKLK